MIKYENECVGCPPEMGCLGDECSNRNVPHYYCDKCDKHFEDQEGIVEIFDNAWLIEAKHELTYIEAKEASYYEDGYSVSHYHCSKCLLNYSDNEGENEIKEDILIRRYKKAFDFEEEIHPYITELTGANLSISEEEASKGNKSLKIELGEAGTFKLAFNLDYLNQIFKLSDVASINFDIKGKSSAKDVYYESKTNEWGVIRYEPQTTFNDAGVTTYWKTMSFTKDMLSDLNDSNVVIRIDNSQNNVIYIDNIRAASKSADVSFENGAISKPDSDNNYIIYDSTRSDDAVAAMVNGQNLNIEINNEKVSDGSTSLRIKTTAPSVFSLYIPYSLYLEAEGSGICYDIFISSCDVMHVYSNDFIQPRPFVNNENHGLWETFYIPFENIEHFNNSWARILSNSGYSANNFDFYVDNIRVAKNYNINFENEKLLEENNRSAMISFDNRNTYEITDEISYTGAYSLKIDPSEPWVKSFSINNVIYNNIPSTGGISLYVYSNYELNFGPTDNYHYWNPTREWKEIRIAKQDINPTDFDHFLFVLSADVIIYIDNIQVVAEI